MNAPATLAEWLVTADAWSRARAAPPTPEAPPATPAQAPHAADVSVRTRAIAAGDRDALASMYREWFDAMYRAARRVSGRDEAFCLDVVQDAMLRVIRGLPTLETRRDLWCWLRTVVRCCACDRLRAEARRRRRELAVAPGRREAPVGPEALPALEERAARLRARLERLDDRNAQLLVMRYRFGWTLERIGESLGLGPGAVDGRLRRAAARLRRRRGHDDG